MGDYFLFEMSDLEKRKMNLRSEAHRMAEDELLSQYDQIPIKDFPVKFFELWDEIYLRLLKEEDIQITDKEKILIYVERIERIKRPEIRGYRDYYDKRVMKASREAKRRFRELYRERPVSESKKDREKAQIIYNSILEEEMRKTNVPETIKGKILTAKFINIFDILKGL